jgi:RNA polymerase sigma factor (sigma-70 family)
MRRSDRDLLKVPEEEFGWLNQDELLRLVVILRDSLERAKTKRARKAWEMLIALDIDRVRGIVTTFRFPGQNVSVGRSQIEDVVHDAYERLVRMLRNFRGASEGEYRAAMRTCVQYACMDHCRKEMGLEQGIRGSLDEVVGETGDERSRFDRAIAALERERIDEEQALERALERRAKVDDAIEQLDGNQRVVIEMTRDRCTTDQIAERLGISHANVYKIRERALAALREILDGDDEP